MDVFKLAAKITLDKSGYEKELNEASKSTSSFGSKLSSGVKKVGKVAAGAVASAATATGAIVKSAVTNYADYEQLVGGAELMFGDAYSYVADKAKNAYSTVQMSTNDYLTQVNGFATGLKTSLGGNEKAAAELADKIINAEADIVAATGNTQENVQNAFNGIMKGNYTMLDNLQLGITPTKEGMQEVIDKVNDWNEAQGNASNYTIDSLADCEAAVVDYVSMVGMSGYAHDEAAGTIQGSLAMAKSSWDNLLTAMGDPKGDVSGAIDALVSSASTLGENVIPVIEKALTGVGTLISELAPKIAEMIPSLVANTLPELLSAASQIIQGLVTGIIAVLPTLVPAAVETILQLSTFLIQQLPQILSVGLDIIVSLIQGIAQALPELMPQIVQVVTEIINVLVEHMPELIEAGLEITLAIIEGLLNALPEIIAGTIKIIETLITTIVQKLPEVLASGKEVLGNFVSGIVGALGNIASAAVQMNEKLLSGIRSGFSKIVSIGSTLISKVVEGLRSAWSSLTTIGGDLVKGIWSGINDKVGWIKDKIVGFGSAVTSKIKSIFGIHSPSRVMRDQVGKFLALGLADGITDNTGYVQDAMDNMLDITDTSVDLIPPDAFGGTQLSLGSDYGDITIPVYIGTERIDEVVVTAMQRSNYRSGGR